MSRVSLAPITHVNEGDDWVPLPAPSVESLALPPLTDEEPGERAIGLLVGHLTKEPHEHHELDTPAW